jgi:hypothetical protein
MLVASQQHRSLMLISVERNGKNQLESGQGSMVDAALLSCCSLLRNPWSKQTGTLEHYREGETNSSFSIFCGISF